MHKVATVNLVNDMAVTARRAKLNSKNSEAFTLVEIIAVMAIVTAIFVLSWGAFYRMRTTMRLRQVAETMKADLVYAQRSAMFVQRNVDENWTYGIGVDIAGMVDGGEDLSYTVFKWCSGGEYYPYNDKAFLSAMSNDPYGASTDCRSSKTEIIAVEDKENIPVSSQGMTAAVGYGNAEQDVRFIVYESVTGIPHFFASDGSSISTTSVQIVVKIGERSNGVSVNMFGDISLIPGAQIGGGGGGSGSIKPPVGGKEECDPSCDEVECGYDGCGKACSKVCGKGMKCIGNRCFEKFKDPIGGIGDDDCVPDCKGKECGSDGCGGICSKCTGFLQVCTTKGTCESLLYGGGPGGGGGVPIGDDDEDCTSDCKNKECGDDGCGGSCGDCGFLQRCSKGNCVFLLKFW